MFSNRIAMLLCVVCFVISFNPLCPMVSGVLGGEGFRFLLAGDVMARTWYISSDGTGDAPTIQAGIDSAVVGDTVLVSPGTYIDTHDIEIGADTMSVIIHLYKNIVVRSDEGPRETVLDWTSSDHAFYAEGVDESATIKGFMFFTEAIDWEYRKFAVFCTSGITVEENWFINRTTRCAVSLKGSDPGLKIIRKNLFIHNQRNIWLETSNVLIENNTIDGMPDGFYFETPDCGVDGMGATDVTVTRNIFYLTYDPPCGPLNLEESVVFEFNCMHPWVLDRSAAGPAQFYDENGNARGYDPQFCSLTGANYNYYIQSDSPCAPGNHPTDPNILIGVFEVNCGEVPAKETTWGAVKSRYRSSQD